MPLEGVSWAGLVWQVLMGAVGAAVGSFANVVLSRVPRGMSLLAPPSHCEGCGRLLAAWEMIPAVGYLLCRGRCRTCGVRLRGREPLVELGVGVAFALVAGWDGLTARAVRDLWLTGLLVVAAAWDLADRRIPNALVLPGALGVLLWQAVFAPGGFLLAAAGAAAVGGLLLILAVASRGGVGGGDVKLGALVGLGLGPLLGLFSLTAAAALGSAVGGLLWLVGRPVRSLPFAPLMLVSTLAALFVHGRGLLFL